MSVSNIKNKDLFNPSGILHIDEYVFSKEYPWELLGGIKEYVKSLIAKGLDGYHLLEGHDDVLVGEGTVIYPTASITGPAIIGKRCEVRPGAFIRGSVLIGDECVIGNSSEFKNCIMMFHCQSPHYNYVGDSILGNYAHTGAGVICSNLRSDNKPVKIHASEGDIETGIRKIGAIIGDRGDIGCQSVLNPGTIIGQNTQVYPLTMCRGVYKENSIVKATRVVVDKK